MLLYTKLLYAFLRYLFKSKIDLLIELAVKDQQLAIYRKKLKHPRLKNRDRRFSITLSRLWPGWRESLVIVKPETVILWHRFGFKYYWRWKSHRKEGRPEINTEVRFLIRKISRENPSWGNMRIRDDLKFLGIEASINTIKKYRVK